MDLEEIGINAENWVDSAQDRNYWRALVNAALNLRVPYAMELVNICIYFAIWIVKTPFHYCQFKIWEYREIQF